MFGADIFHTLKVTDLLSIQCSFSNSQDIASQPFKRIDKSYDCHIANWLNKLLWERQSVKRVKSQKGTGWNYHWNVWTTIIINFIFSRGDWLWPLFLYLHQQFRVLIIIFCVLDTTLGVLNTWYRLHVMNFYINKYSLKWDSIHPSIRECLLEFDTH